MVYGSKKKKIGKAKLKKIASLKSKKSAEKEGKGAGSRKSFCLPAKWSEKHQNRREDATKICQVRESSGANLSCKKFGGLL